MKIKYLLIAVLLCAFGYGLASAGQPKFTIPISVNNIADPGLKSAGVEKCQLVTSTTPALMTDIDSVTMTEGFVYWIVVPSTTGATALFLELRSTDTANVSTARLIPKIQPSINASGAASAGRIIFFDPPLPFENGLSYNLGPAASTPDGSNDEYAIGVRWKKE